MRIRPKSSITSLDAPGSVARTRRLAAAEHRPDEVEISVTSEALNRTDNVHSLTAAVGAGAYEASSGTTSQALVEDALLKGDLTYD